MLFILLMESKIRGETIHGTQFIDGISKGY
jgi:hypothetical protein